MIRMRYLAVAFVLGATIGGPTSASAAGGGVISINGQVGPDLRMGKSSAAAVRAYAGRPTRVIRGFGAGGRKTLQYRYECGRGCFTLYFFARTGTNRRLANFITTSKRWITVAGTGVGDDLDDAERFEGKDSEPVGCGDGLVIEKTGAVTLYVSAFLEPVADFPTVSALALEGRNSVLGC